MQGFLGTRASLFVDLALVIFIAMPPALLVVVSWARRGLHRRHRAAQIALFSLMTTAVALLELDIRLSGGTSAIAGRAVAVSSGVVRGLLLVHIAVAVATWIAWVVLLVRSLRRFERDDHALRLPGAFSQRHRRWGRAVFLGVAFTAASGTVLYVAAFV